MSTFHAPRSGAPTFTAAPASLSLSGLDDFAPLTAESDMIAPEWYHGQDHYHHPQVHGQPTLSPVDELVVSAGFALPSHGVPTSGDAFAASQFAQVDVPMGHPYQYQNGAPRLDDLTPLSPLQPHYNPTNFPTPYPDSTASSAPSDEPIAADADEDKRKRNQAASARFRQKKKQREAQMVEQSRDAVEKNRKLVAELEGMKRENVFLRKLLVEKVDNMSDADKELLVTTTKDVAKGKP